MAFCENEVARNTIPITGQDDGDVAMKTVHLLPDARVSLYLWRATGDGIRVAARHVRTYSAHRPVASSAIRGGPRSSAQAIYHRDQMDSSAAGHS